MTASVPLVTHYSSLITSRLESAPVKRILLVLCAVLVANACGKRGDPRPPVPIIPKATSDLVVTQRGSKVILTWSYPSLTTAGKSLTDIRRVVVYRASEDVPVAPAGSVDTSTPQPVSLFAKIPPLTPAQFQKQRTRLDAIEASSLPGVTNGARLVYED